MLAPSHPLRRLACLLLALPALVLAAPEADDPGAIAAQLVDNFRALLRLHEASPQRLTREDTQTGHRLFFQNRMLATRLVDLAAASPTACDALLARLASGEGWQEADRLALGGTLTELGLRLPAGAACAPGVARERLRVAAIRARYDREFTAALGAARGAPPARPAWNAYLAFVHAQRPASPEPVPPPATAPGPANPHLADAGARDEWVHGDLPPQTLLLTFDDGPHPAHTPRVLDILKRYGIKAVFFQIGQNLGSAGEGRQTLREVALVRRMLDEGHTIANHTYTHPLLPHLDEVAVSAEIDRTEQLLAAVAAGHPGHAPLFRPPYGARNDLVLAEVTARGLRSVIWNIDSRDWADPIPRSVVQRVVDEATHEGRGIILLHDIHPRTVAALPILLDELVRRGFRFARYQDGALVAP